jgi:CD36 family
VGLALYNQQVQITKNASEWLFDGYADPLMDLMRDNPIFGASDIPYDRFGWFYTVS